MFLKGYQLGSSDEQKANGELVRINAVTKKAIRAIRNLPSKCRSWIYRRGSKRCEVEVWRRVRENLEWGVKRIKERGVVRILRFFNEIGIWNLDWD
jgi:hypothetical protein